LPFTVVIEKVIGNIEAIIARRARLTQQSHPCFIRRTSAFAPVARDAGTNHIVPDVLPTPPPRDNMV